MSGILGQLLNSSVVLTAVCRPTSCRLTGWDTWSGVLQWTRAGSGAVRIVCQADALDTADGRGGDHCGPQLTTPDRVGTVDADDGGLHWQAGLRPPDGTVDRTHARIVAPAQCAPTGGALRTNHPPVEVLQSTIRVLAALFLFLPWGRATRGPAGMPQPVRSERRGCRRRG